MEALKCGCCRVRSMWRNFPACEGAVLVFMVYSFARVPAVVGMKVEDITNKANTGKCVCTKTAASTTRSWAITRARNISTPIVEQISI